MKSRFSVLGSVFSLTIAVVVSLPVAQAASADLSVSIATPVANILKGEVITYKVSVLNNGPAIATSFTFTDDVPAGLTFVSAPTGCTLNGSTVTCASGKLGVNAARTFALKFSTASAACGAVVTSSASVSSSADTNAGNDTSNTVSTTIACPDFSITKSAPASIVKGDLLQYVIKVVNNGPSVVQTFTMTDAVPAGLTFVSGPVGCSLVGSTVTCSARIAAGSYRNFILKFSSTSATCGAITNTASVSAAYDPNTSNDTSNTVSTTVMCQEADVSVTKSGPTNVLKGNSLIYSVTASNAGPTTVTNTYAHDSIPAGLTFLPAESSAKCKVVGSSVDCYAGNLATGKSATFTLAFSTSAATCDSTIQNVATVTAKGAVDPNTANNTSATVSTNVTCAAVIENELTIVQKQTATTDTAVKNQKDVSLLRFESHATNENILATSFIFDAAQGSLINMQNYKLWVDTDDNGVVDTVLQSGVSSVSAAVTFDSLAGGGYIIPATESVVFEVHADVASSLVSNTLQLKFSTTLSNYVASERALDGSPISGIKTDGACATVCEMTVFTGQATIYTLRSQGDLIINKSTTPTRPRMVLGGTLSDDVMRLQFHSEYEAIDVTNLVFTASGPNAGTFATNIDRIELYLVGSVTPFATATVAGCGSTSVPSNSMCVTMNSQEFVIPKGSNTNFLARLRVKTDIDGSVSGQQVKLTLDAVVGAQARGLVSSNNLSANDGDGVSEGELVIGSSSYGPSQTIVATDNVVVHSKVTSITNASPDANGTAIPSGSQRQIGQFKFSTAAAINTKNGTNKWTLSDIIFNVNATNVLLGTGDQTSLATSDFNIYNKADPTTKSTCTANKATASGVLMVTCSDITSSFMNAEIDPGTDATFVLQADVVNNKINNAASSTLQVSFQNFDSMSNVTFGPSASHVRSLDKDNASSTQFLWIEFPETSVNGTTYNG